LGDTGFVLGDSLERFGRQKSIVVAYISTLRTDGETDDLP